MKELSISASPGVVALFLLETSHIPGQDHDVSNPLLNVVAPYGVNHHNINVDILQKRSSYDYSLFDVYRKPEFGEDLDANKIMSICDNISTPLVALPFSVVNRNELCNNQSSLSMVNLLNNNAIKEFVALAPKIVVTRKAKVKFSDPTVNKGKNE